MTEKLNVMNATIAGAITGVVLSLVCAALVFSMPGLAMGMFNNMIHTDITMMPRAFMPIGFVVGLVLAAIIGALIAGVFAWSYNMLSKK